MGWGGSGSVLRTECSMSSTRNKKKVGISDGDIDIESKRGAGGEKKKKFSLQPTKKLFREVFRTDNEKKLSDDGNISYKGSIIAAGVADSGHLVGSRRDKIALFEENDFDVDGFCKEHMANLTEKGINTLRGDLATLQEHCEEEVQRVIHGHYPAFVKACEGVGELETEFQQLRSLIAGTAGLMNDLKKAAQMGLHKQDNEEAESLNAGVDLGPGEALPVHGILQELDVAIAERDFHVVKKLLETAEESVIQSGVSNPSCWELEIETRREKVVSLLEHQLHDPSLGTLDQQNLFRILVDVAGDVPALRILLGMHSNQVRQAQQQFLKPHRAGGNDPHGTDYVGSISQCVFHQIGHAVEDFHAIFGNRNPALTGVLVVWANSETKQCCRLIKQHALSALAGPSGLASTIHCVSLALVYAIALEEAHQLRLVNVLRTEFWPYVGGVLKLHVKSVVDSISTHAREELEPIIVSPSAWIDAHRSTPQNSVQLISGQRLLAEIDHIIDLLKPIAQPSLAPNIAEGVKSLFKAFTASLGKALKEHMMDGTISQSVAGVLETIMETVSALCEDLIPQCLSKIEGMTGRVGGPESLRPYVDDLAESLGMQQEVG